MLDSLRFVKYVRSFCGQKVLSPGPPLPKHVKKDAAGRPFFGKGRLGRMGDLPPEKAPSRT